MRLAALVSGGKDGMFAAYLAQKQGDDIVCLVTITPESEESMLCHYPNTQYVTLQAKSMNIPLIHAKSDNDKESIAFENALLKAKQEYRIEGIVHGGIHSKYQKEAFAKIARHTQLRVSCPLWGTKDIDHMNALVDANFRFIIIAVASDGLDDTWLGHEVTSESIRKLDEMSSKFGFNPSFEGGEAETFVLDCPLFGHPIKIQSSKIQWDGYRGKFKIQEAMLDIHA